LSTEEQCALYGCSAEKLSRWKVEPSALRDDVLDRIALLLAIFGTLQRLLPGEAGNTWIKAPNADRLLGGGSALSLMSREGTEGIRRVRDYLDAQAWRV
jgi:hypothetical protein